MSVVEDKVTVSSSSPAWPQLINAIERLAATRTLAEIGDVIRTTARAIARSDGITFVLRDGEDCRYVAEDAISPLWVGQKFPLTACISGWCMLNRKTAIVPDIYADDRIPHDAYRPTFVASLVMTPVGADVPQAAIGAYWAKPQTPSAEVIEMLSALARSTAIAIRNVGLSASLRESESRCAQFIEALPAAVYVTDAAGKITYFNKAAFDLAGMTLDIGSQSWQSNWSIHGLDGKPMPQDRTPMALTLRQARPSAGVELIVERHNGERVPVLAYPTPIFDSATGQMTGALNMFVDISERKSAESAIRTLLDELNHRVKNNLQMLASMLDMSRRASENQEARQTIGQAANRVAAMASAQRTLYVTGHSSHIDCKALIQAVCNSLDAFRQADVDLAIEAGEVHNDTAMPLALIVNELVTNALKHSVRDGMRPSIRLRAKKDGSELVLRASDGGPGVQSFAAGSSRQSGLQLVEALTRQLRGTFSMAPGPGAQCTVRFPDRLHRVQSEGETCLSAF